MLDTEITTALQAVTEAARIQRQARRSLDFTIGVKPDRSLITSVDRACEDAIVALLRERFPDDGVFSEESGLVEEGSSERTWVIDPLDGTRYFVHGFDDFGPFVALKDTDGSLLGMVMQPMTGVIWWAGRGCGSFRRPAVDQPDERLHAPSGRPVPELADTMIAMGGPRKLLGGGVSLDRLAPRFGSWLNVPSFRGFTAVAEGKLDVYIASGLKEWDIRANELIVREAGGAVIRLPRHNGLHAIAARTPELARAAHAAIDECPSLSDGTCS